MSKAQTKDLVPQIQHIRHMGNLQAERDAFLRLFKEAHEDNHEVTDATHVITKDGEMAGCAALASIPMLDLWFNSKRMKARDSLFCWEALMAIARDRGLDHVVVPCAEHSPLRPYLERMGATNEGTTTLYKVNLKKRGDE